MSPLVTWQRPVVTESPARLTTALSYADKARNEYQQARDARVSAASGVNASLLGLGILGTGLALAHSHRDAFTGTGLLGASIYAFGQQNVTRLLAPTEN